MKIKENIFTIIKNDDIDKYLNDEMRVSLGLILSRISVARMQDGKKGVNEYYVCNKDEPYSDKVLNAILEGEHDKTSDKKECDFCNRLKKMKEIFDENKKEGYSDDYKAALEHESYYNGEYCGGSTFHGFDLNYCPCCGEKL